MKEETLQQEVWRRAVDRLNADVLQLCPNLNGGRKDKETPEQYGRRCIAEIERAIGRLREAQTEYQRVGGKTP